MRHPHIIGCSTKKVGVMIIFIRLVVGALAVALATAAALVGTHLHRPDSLAVTPFLVPGTRVTVLTLERRAASVPRRLLIEAQRRRRTPNVSTTVSTAAGLGPRRRRGQGPPSRRMIVALSNSNGPVGLVRFMSG